MSREMPWPHQDGVMTLSRRERFGLAQCQVCLWGAKRASLAMLRKAAHRHVSRTGHAVEVCQTLVYTYGPDERQP